MDEYCFHCGLELYEEHEQDRGICDDCVHLMEIDEELTPIRGDEQE